MLTTFKISLDLILFGVECLVFFAVSDLAFRGVAPLLPSLNLLFESYDP